MAQTGSVWKKWVTLTDRGDELGSKLYSGSPIYAYVSGFKMSGKSNYGYDPRVMSGLDYIGSAVGSAYRENLAQNSYTSFENNMIDINGNWTTDLGSVQDGGAYILTPYKILVLATSGRRFFLKDERVIEQMVIESGSTTFSEHGIPVVITDYNFDYNSSNLNNVPWSLKMREDRA